MTAELIASVPVMPSAEILAAAAPSALSCAELIEVASATPVEVLPSKLVISPTDCALVNERLVIERIFAMLLSRAVSCAAVMLCAFTVADAAATLESKLPISVASSEEASARLVIASTFAMLLLRIPLPSASKLAPSTLTVAANAVLPRRASRLVTAEVMASVPVTPSVRIFDAPAPTWLSCDASIAVATATAPVALLSKAEISPASSVEASAKFRTKSTLLLLIWM